MLGGGDYESGDLLIAVVDAINAAGGQITRQDAAAVALAKTYAAQIDEVIDSGDAASITKALYLGPHLLNALDTLGLTPKARKAVSEVQQDKAGGKLAQLRAMKTG